ncbi:putative serpin-like protein [Aphelenchoides besseyi]|nr:putative serpin-like protein [Aphelenchoides besseyi]
MSETNKKEMADLAFIEATTEFAVGLLRETAINSTASCILSPISIALALSLAYSGSSGDTRKEFDSVFAKGGINNEALNSLFHQTLQQLTSPDKNITLEIANRAYTDQRLNIKPEYKELITKNFNGDFKQVDFSQADSTVKEINDFVAKTTHDKIQNLLSNDAISAQTKLVLINAVYFKGNWFKQFDEKRTTDEKFFVAENKDQQVKMMKMKTKVNYVENSDVQVLELPYADSHASFVAFLPKEKFGLADWVKKTNGSELLKLKSQFERREVNIELPRFKINSQIELNDVLDKLGFSEGFSKQADFSGITSDGDLFISQVIHKAFIESNESGTEAAASTAIIMSRMIGDPIEQFVADHPFLFGVNEVGSEAAAATGIVMTFASMPEPTPEPIRFKADHPFVYGIYFNGQPLFLEGSEAAAATALVMNRGRPSMPPVVPVFKADHPFFYVISYADHPLFFGNFMG